MFVQNKDVIHYSLSIVALLQFTLLHQFNFIFGLSHQFCSQVQLLQINSYLVSNSNSNSHSHFLPNSHSHFLPNYHYHFVPIR